MEKAVSEAVIAAGGTNAKVTAAELVQAVVSTGGAGLDESIFSLAGQIELLGRIAGEQSQAVTDNTQAVLQNTTVQGGRSVAATAGSVATTVLKTLGGGLGVVPLVSSIVGLFRDKQQETPATLATYTAPEPIDFAGAAMQPSGLQIPAVDCGQDGLPRIVGTRINERRGAETQGLNDSESPAAPVYAPSITVQVQAMDSRSFLDHSDDIARAVREAILNSHSLGDVVSEI
jgi:hypothetical protein